MNTATALRFPAELPRGHLASLQVDRLAAAKARASAAAAPAGMTLHYQGGRAVQQRQKSWVGVRANVAQMHCDGDLLVDLGAGAARLSVVLEGVGGHLEIASKQWSSRLPADDAARPLSIIPPALQAYGRGNGIRFIRHLVLEFDTAAIEGMAEDEIDLADVFAPRPMFADPGILRLAHLVADECGRDAPHSRLYGDNLSMALLLALSRLGGKQPSTITRGCLAPWQLRRVGEYLHAHLGEDVQLHALADVVKLSRSYFSRAFKASTGHTPHQWLLQARIAKAKQLMLESDSPLAQVAVDVGFADQAHFTRNFGRAVGESPGAWRRNRCADAHA
jgi:AraC family transcriptional regulator